MIPKFLAGAIGVMLAELGTTGGGRKVGSGVRVVGSALVLSSLGALGQPWAKESVAWRHWRCGCTRRARSLDGEPWAPWHLRDGQRKNSPRRTTGRNRQPRTRRADGLVPEAAEVLGLPHLRVPNRVGLLYTQILGSHPASLSR